MLGTGLLGDRVVCAGNGELFFFETFASSPYSLWKSSDGTSQTWLKTFSERITSAWSDEDGRVYMLDQHYRKLEIFRPAHLKENEGSLGKAFMALDFLEPEE